MENEIRQKSNRGLIILVIILFIAVIGLSGYIIYEKTDKSSIYTGTDCLTEESTSENSENSYTIFANNLKEAVSQYKTENDNNYQQYQYVRALFGNLTYNVSLNAKGELYIIYNSDTVSFKIASKVLSFAVVSEGQGGMQVLYFIREDGTVSSADIETTPTVAQNGSFTLQDNIGNYKNIVAIIGGTHGDEYSGADIPLFIDINGNIHHQ